MLKLLTFYPRPAAVKRIDESAVIIRQVQLPQYWGFVGLYALMGAVVGTSVFLISVYYPLFAQPWWVDALWAIGIGLIAPVFGALYLLPQRRTIALVQLDPHVKHVFVHQPKRGVLTAAVLWVVSRQYPSPLIGAGDGSPEAAESESDRAEPTWDELELAFVPIDISRGLGLLFRPVYWRGIGCFLRIRARLVPLAYGTSPDALSDRLARLPSWLTGLPAISTRTLHLKRRDQEHSMYPWRSRAFSFKDFREAEDVSTASHAAWLELDAERAQGLLGR